MASDQNRCTKCGKLFAPHPGKSMCARCSSKYDEDLVRVREAVRMYGKRTDEEIAAYSGLSVGEVVTLMQDPEFDAPESEDLPLCGRCKERPAQRYAEYCLSCRLEMNRAFGQAARILASQIENEIAERRLSERIKSASASSTIQRKRASAPGSRIDTRPGGRYSPQ